MTLGPDRSLLGQRVRACRLAGAGEAPVIEKILMHLGLQARVPPRAPARGQARQAAWRPGIAHRKRLRKTIFDGAVNAQQT
jgi:hypothetical protein